MLMAMEPEELLLERGLGGHKFSCNTTKSCSPSFVEVQREGANESQRVFLFSSGS